MNANLYDRDFFEWINVQAELLRCGKASEADIPNIIEELETLARSEVSLLSDRLRNMQVLLLKWLALPGLQSGVFRQRIAIARMNLVDLMSESPSLNKILSDVAQDSYESARLEVCSETGLPEGAFPQGCPWTFEQLVSADFLPSDAESILFPINMGGTAG